MTRCAALAHTAVTVLQDCKNRWDCETLTCAGICASFKPLQMNLATAQTCTSVNSPCSRCASKTGLLAHTKYAGPQSATQNDIRIMYLLKDSRRAKGSVDAAAGGRLAAAIALLLQGTRDTQLCQTPQELLHLTAEQIRSVVVTNSFLTGSAAPCLAAAAKALL